MADVEDNAVKQISDVSPPNQTPAAPTSKPVILSNHPVMKDPMVVAEKTAADDAPVTTAVKLPTKITLQPIHANVVPDTPSAFDKPVEQPTATPTEDESEPSAEKDDNKNASNDQPATPESDAKLLADDADEEIIKRNALDALIANKKYFLRINSAESLRTQRSITIGIVLTALFGVAWLDIALDAGLIMLGNLHAVTNFF